MKQYEKLLEKKQEAQFRYLNSPKGAKNTRFEQLKNITKNLLKIETKRRAKNAYVSQKH